MNNDERMYLLDECIKQYQIALSVGAYVDVSTIDKFKSLIRANFLKQIIEKFIDCQPTKYYKKYSLIVALYQKTI